MAWHWLDDKPLSEAMMVRLLTHICVTPPQWVKAFIQLNVNYTRHMDQHRLRKWLAACWQQAITWSKLVLSPKLFCCIHMRAVEFNANTSIQVNGIYLFIHALNLMAVWLDHCSTWTINELSKHIKSHLVVIIIPTLIPGKTLLFFYIAMTS